MIRIYLDKNVITALKKGSRPEDIAMLQKLRQHKEHFIIPFSDALMSDLAHRYDADDLKKREMTEADLEFIAELSEHNLITTELKNPNAVAGIADPRVYFQNFTIKEEPTDVMAVFKELQNEPGELGLAGKMMIDALNVQNPLKVPGLENTPMAKMYSGDTFGEAIISMLNFVTEMQKDPSTYKELRKFVISNLNIGSHISSFDQDVIQKLDAVMQDSALNKTFLEFNDLIIASQPKKPEEQSNWDKFLLAFSNLDMIGYKSDSMDNGYNNYLNDLKHAFYGAHCDFFVTEDRKTAGKAKVAYEIENIPTKVYSVSEMLVYLEGLSFKSALNELEESIVFDESKVESTSIYCSLENQGEIHEWIISSNLFTFFNQLVIYRFIDSGYSYVFRRTPKNYSNFVYYSEVEKLVNHLYNSFGNDIDGRGKYDESDSFQVKGGNWLGRRWLINEIFVSFNIPVDKSNPVLILHSNS